MLKTGTKSGSPAGTVHRRVVRPPYAPAKNHTSVGCSWPAASPVRSSIGSTGQLAAHRTQRAASSWATRAQGQGRDGQRSSGEQRQRSCLWSRSGGSRRRAAGRGLFGPVSAAWSRAAGAGRRPSGRGSAARRRWPGRAVSTASAPSRQSRAHTRVGPSTLTSSRCGWSSPRPRQRRSAGATPSGPAVRQAQGRPLGGRQQRRPSGASERKRRLCTRPGTSATRPRCRRGARAGGRRCRRCPRAPAPARSESRRSAARPAPVAGPRSRSRAGWSPRSSPCRRSRRPPGHTLGAARVGQVLAEALEVVCELLGRARRRRAGGARRTSPWRRPAPRTAARPQRT